MTLTEHTDIVILSSDAIFSRMIELEARALGYNVRYISEGLESMSADMMIADLDGGWKILPSFTGRYILGYTKEYSIPAKTAAMCTEVLHRPFRVSYLRRRLTELLGAPTPKAMSESAAEEYTNAPRTVIEFFSEGNGRSRLITVGGHTVKLSRAEYIMLEALLKKRGELVEREELEALLGYGSNGNLVDVYMCRLRKKLEDPDGARLITSVRGKGYRLNR